MVRNITTMPPKFVAADPDSQTPRWGLGKQHFGVREKDSIMVAFDYAPTPPSGTRIFGTTAAVVAVGLVGAFAFAIMRWTLPALFRSSPLRQTGCC
jgi:hypothetical protein